ncbi:MAG: hypothetical protein DWQ36_04775 [Acidobacteria bacterium]|nr:MAG: hypothetical protein DWQ30_20635 [Acidobacteriota bacterium]REK10110.1 MAG: hypothetical protein DWQ36_04775 [Acidobacteriota bacterium]
MERGSVAVFADLVADRFISGTPTRVSREAPVVILDQDGDRFVAGGGANAAANVASLGGRAHLFGAVGDDRAGRRLAETIERAGIDPGSLLELAGHATATKTRILGGFGSNKQQIVRIDSGGVLPADAARDRRLREALIHHLETAASSAGEPPVLMVSDYGYGTVDPGIVAAVRSRLPACHILVDSRHRLAQFEQAGFATPNQEEAEALLGQRLDEDSALLTHGPRLRRTLGCEHLLITRGSRGMALFLADRCLMIPVYGTDEVRDVTGAGDTVIGTMALAVAAGAAPAEAAALANFAGGIVVLKAGTATVRQSELRSAIGSAEGYLEALQWEEC